MYCKDLTVVCVRARQVRTSRISPQATLMVSCIEGLQSFAEIRRSTKNQLVCCHARDLARSLSTLRTYPALAFQGLYL